ncbi:MAG TPA: hypothetical protein PLC54_05130 [Spirochaetales bacterium]|nr:hypothetical protein [Spirochaetales bacterium]
MAQCTEWRETAYCKSYDSTLTSLRRRREEDPSFGIVQLRALLDNLYIQDGNDWVGRGELQDIAMQATLDAHESFLAELEAEQRPS